MASEFGPDFALAKQLSDFEKRIKNLETRDVLQNASVGAVELSSVLVSPSATTGSASNFIVPLTTPTSFVTINTTVPEGFSRALVAGNGFINAGNNGSDSRLYSHVRIAGVNGPDSIATIAVGQLWGNESAFSTRAISGLTAGGTITCELQAWLTINGPTDPSLQAFNVATLAVQVLFLI